MTMYLDDLRTPVEEFDFIVRSYSEAIKVCKTHGIPNYISFDYDLDVEGKKSGLNFVKWLIQADISKEYLLPSDFSYKVHSQNPEGKKKIEQLLSSYLIQQRNSV